VLLQFVSRLIIMGVVRVILLGLDSMFQIAAQRLRAALSLRKLRENSRDVLVQAVGEVCTALYPDVRLLSCCLNVHAAWLSGSGRAPPRYVSSVTYCY